MALDLTVKDFDGTRAMNIDLVIDLIDAMINQRDRASSVLLCYCLTSARERSSNAALMGVLFCQSRTPKIEQNLAPLLLAMRSVLGLGLARDLHI